MTEKLRRALQESGLSKDAVSHIMGWYQVCGDEAAELRGRVERLERALVAVAKSLHELSELIGDLIRGARFMEE